MPDALMLNANAIIQKAAHVMTLPIHDRTCHRCDFEGDVSLFWRRDASGEYIKSPHPTVPIDKLRYGYAEAQKYAYYPYREFCPKCGYECDSSDERIDAAFYQRRSLREQRRLNSHQSSGCILFLVAFPALIGPAIWLLGR